MPEIKLLHLYHDLMNLYGEYGNLRILSRHLEDQGFFVTTDRKSVGDALSFEGYDFIYIGSGTESNQKTALRHLRDFREALVAAAESGTVILLTGNAADMMGKTVTAGDGTVYEGVGLLDFTAVESATSRITGDAICKCEWFTKPLVGFINKCSSLEGIDYSPFVMQMGEGNKKGDPHDGYRYSNVIATHLTGPVLVKNPHLTTYFVKLLGIRRDEDFQLRELSYPNEQNAYEITLTELLQRMK